jgi:hypothetical protein
MIPVYAYRYLPAGRGTWRHPVLSIYQSDINHEFTGPHRSLSPDWTPPPMVPFWSEFL